MSAQEFVIKMEIFGGLIGHRVQVLTNDAGRVTFPSYEAARECLPPDRTTELGVSFRYWVEAAPAELAGRGRR